MDKSSAARMNRYTWFRLFLVFSSVLVINLADRLWDNRRTLSWQWVVGSVTLGLVAFGVMSIAVARQSRNSVDAAKQNLYVEER